MDPRLIVVRGNSGAGKSSVAQAIRRAHGPGVAWIEQDYVRRILLNELEPPELGNVALVEQITRTAIGQRYHAVLDGVFHTVWYGEMLARLAREYDAYFFHLEVPLEETIRRHGTREKAKLFPADDLRAWYRERDLLADPVETVIDHTSSLDETVRRILGATGLGAG
ncbi:putative kinase [Kribbella amoyensis]|uniref:Putative kinase n=1 Tax=Kribbella amoyensis TaxID=996641 RepID=A0A561BMD6_9ACTN|nr:AAA family ATPase [Kribbella amoyensis]TWD79987.1 putative kinase [Kribbella amoyensis]